ncbi:MAG: hypothetical protein JWP10_877 [Nocardioidaceae bacterium]|nr:hypothetical protein [Nocardioidaceae bacterium]
MTHLVSLPVILPLLAAGLCLVFGRSASAQRIISIVVLSTTVTIAAILLYRADQYGPQVVHVGGWPAQLGISLVADRLSALMLLVSSVVTLIVLLYSLGQGISEFGRETPLSVFHPTYLVLSAGVSNAFLSADLFNLFVGFEILLAASYVLITLGGTESRIRSGTTYIVVSLLSSVIFLIGIASVYAATGTTNFADLSGKMADVAPSVQLILQLLLLTAFAIKAAVFPLSSWLPDSYPTAPAPVTAVFAGLLTKVGVYAIIRIQTLIFPDSPLNDLLLWVALATMVVGILGAVAQSDIKRMLSFTLVSHIGYMIFGIALGTDLGLSGAIFYVAHHITIQTTLFLVTGLIELRGGSTALDKLGGLAKASPLLAVMFFIPAMNLAGIPPLSGFLGKLALVEAGTGQPGWLSTVVVVGAIVTSLLTLYAVARAWNRAFWQPRSVDASEVDEFGALYSGHADTQSSPSGQGRGVAVEAYAVDERLPRAMVLPTLALVAVGVGLTLAAGPLFALTSHAAVELHERTPYIQAVLGVSP